MFKQNMMRLVTLGVLILLCIWQTITLWLGDMSGHNFFWGNAINYEASYVRPKQIWTNINGKKIYKIESYTEKEEILQELTQSLRKSGVALQVQPKQEYVDLLYKSHGMIYEFATELTIDEIIGQPLKPNISKYEPIKIKEIYVDLSGNNKRKRDVYLVDVEGKIRQKITLTEELELENQIVSLYKNEEDVKHHRTYQSNLINAGEKKFFKGSSYYPQGVSQNPIEIKRFKLTPIADIVGSRGIENYVNNLFKNPSYKTTYTTDSSITFSDNLTISVKYDEIGTLEFEKTLANDYEKLTDAERMNKINRFIEESEAIPINLKKGLYLEEIISNEVEKQYSYRFGYRYKDSHIIILTEALKEELDINAFLELNIKNNEIISGKWVMFEPQETEAHLTLNMEHTTAIENIYENSGLTQLAEFKLESLECGYIIDKIGKEANFSWIGFYMKEPILGVEKIDNV